MPPELIGGAHFSISRAKPARYSGVSARHAASVVHSREREPLTERIQDGAEDRDRRLTPNEQIHKRLVEGRMRDAVDRETERLDWAAVVRNCDGVFPPQQNANL